MKMKIVHIVNRFVPDAGNQINLLAKYERRNSHEVTIVAPDLKYSHQAFIKFYGIENIKQRDSQFCQNTKVKIIRLNIFKYLSGRAVFKKEIFKIVEDEKPDILFIHGNDTMIAMQYLLRINKLNHPILLDSHMVDVASKNKYRELFRFLYRKAFAPIINRNEIPVIRIQESDYVQKHLGIKASNAPFISVGSDPELFYPDESIRNIFRLKYNIDMKAYVVLYAGKLDENKGGMFLAKALMKRLDTSKDVWFLIIGNTSEEYGERIEDMLRKSENRILRFETQKYIDLPQFYQSSDLVIYPKQCSLSFYDAQACGLPVLFEDIDVNKARTRYGTAKVFKPDNLQDFRRILAEMINLPEDKYRIMSKKAIEYIKDQYSYEKLSIQYLQIMKEVIDKYQTRRR